MRTVPVRLTAEVSQYIARLRAAEQATRGLHKEIGDTAATRRGRAALDDLAGSVATTGTALVAGFAVAAAAAARFDKQMAAVAAVSQASRAEMEQLRQAAIAAGEDTSFTATQAAQAQEELAKAGISTANILGGALAGSLDLAAAGSLDLGEAATIAARAMNIFRLGGADVGRIADVLAAGANKSATDVHELGEALRMGGLAASSVGLTLEDTIGTLAAFADRALIGSDAGTSLKTMLMFLSAPTGKAAELMERLGIAAYNTSGQFVGVVNLAGQLQERLSGLTQAERENALAVIFGSDARRAATVLYELGAQGIQRYVSAVDDQGAATDVARRKTDHLVGDLERLRGELESLAIESGGGASSGLRTLVKAADALVSSLGNAPPVLSGTVVVAAALTGGALLLTAALLKVRAANASMLDSLAQVGPRAERAAAGLGVATKWAGRATAAFVALEVASAVTASFADAAVDTDALAASLKRLAESGERAGELSRLFGQDLGRISSDLQLARNIGGLTGLQRGASIEGLGLGLEFMKVFDNSAQSTLARVQALDAALAQLARGGNARQAAAAFGELQQRAAELGLTQEQLVKLFPQYAGALGEATTATTASTSAQARAQATAQALASSWAEAAQEADGLAAMFEKLNGAAISWAEAEIQLEEAIDSATATIGENGRTLDVNTAAGRANRQALLDLVQATGEAIQARINESGSVQQAVAVYEEGRRALIASAMQAGATKKQAEALADQWLKMPAVVNTTVNTDLKPVTIGPPSPEAVRIAAAQAAAELQRELYRYRLTMPVYASTSTLGRRPMRWGGVVTAARDGLVTQAHVTGSTMIKYGEPETGGEAYVPRYGQRRRSLDILQVAAGWYGQRLVPAGTTSSAASPGSNVTYNIYPQRADWTVADMQALQAREAALARFSRAR